MLYQVQKLRDALRFLTDIVALQISVLEAVSQDARAADLESGKLAEYLQTKRRFNIPGGQDRSQRIAEWVLGKQNLFTSLQSFSEGPEAKRDFVTDIKKDVILLFRPYEEESFQVACSDEDEDWKQGAKDFLYAFYDIWSNTGFSNYLFSHPYEPKQYPYLFSHRRDLNYKRVHFTAEFAFRNYGLYVCVMCDGSAYKTETEKQVHTSIEHFFPRSIYPHLSCHPFNLIPICSACNSYIKGPADPLKPGEAEITVQDLVLPYQGVGLSQLTYIDFPSRENRNRAENHIEHPLTAKFQAFNDVELGKRLEVIDHLYKVEERWDRSLDEIGEQAFRRISQFFALSLIPGNSTSDTDDLEKALKILIALMERDNWGRDPFGIPVTWTLKYYLDQLERLGEEAPIWQIMRIWGGKNSRLEQSLIERADGLIKRAVSQPPEN
jgi:hypothetical protein